MMQCKAKNENLAHILGYQIWAVTGRERQGTMPSLTRRGRGGGARRRGRGQVVDTATAALAMAPVLALSPQ